jgi:hypothetical protein
MACILWTFPYNFRPQFNTIQANGGNRGYKQLRFVKRFWWSAKRKEPNGAKILVKGPFFSFGSFLGPGGPLICKKMGSLRVKFHHKRSDG